jgi:hypothetical protein
MHTGPFRQTCFGALLLVLWPAAAGLAEEADIPPEAPVTAEAVEAAPKATDVVAPAKTEPAVAVKHRFLHPGLALASRLDEVALEEQTLADAADAMRGGALGGPVDVVIDETILAEDILITFSGRRMTLRQVLRAILKPRGLTFAVLDGYIYISTPEGVRAARQPSLRSYNVQDVLGGGILLEGRSRTEAERDLAETLQLFGVDAVLLGSDADADDD